MAGDTITFTTHAEVQGNLDDTLEEISQMNTKTASAVDVSVLLRDD